MSNEHRLYNLLDGESYSDAVDRLSRQDRNAYGQKTPSVSARIRNEVTLESRINLDPGTDMFALCAYLAHGITGMYKKIMESDASDNDKIILANQAKDLEQIAARFAKSVDVRRAERKKIEEEACKKSTSLDGETRTESEKPLFKQHLLSFLSRCQSTLSGILSTKAKKN
jgi:hypothetical protein